MSSKPSKTRAVLFDVDGVLINSDEALHKVFSATLEEFGFGPRKHRQVLEFAGSDDVSWIKKLLPPRARRNKKLVAEMAEHAARLYEKTGIPKWIKPVEGVGTALRKLSGLKLGVITNMRRRQLNHALERFGWKRFFRASVCFEDVKHKKPHPEPLLAAMKKLGANPGESLYVGDTAIDIEAARRAGTIAVLLTHARNKRIKAVYRIDSMNELPALVKRLSQHH